MSEELQAFARKTADALKDPDKKQLRFNEIVACAARFYPADPRGGVRELVQSCDRSNPDLYVKNDPMWHRLTTSYAWMEQGA